MRKPVNLLSLATIVSSSFFGCSTGKYLHIPEYTKAELALSDFPKEIPGAKSVKRYPLPGARYCLVHIRQKHYVSHEMPEEEKRNTEEVQRDIKSILEFLVDKYKTKSVYIEGLTPRIAHQIRDVASFKLEEPSVLEKRLSDFQASGRSKEEIENARIKLAKYKESYARWLNAKDKIVSIVGSSAELAFDGKITPMACELDDYADAAEKELRKPKGERNLDSAAIMDDRENTVFFFITLDSPDKNPISFVVYGAAHEFLDNSMGWNKFKPEKPVSLIEIIPKSLDID